jgi:molybdopterin-containing oxidoreductase family iron-sulfur binding subunit
MAACPYGARSFNYLNPKPFIDRQNPDFPIRTKGVVEKCNLCEERLLENKPPLCVSLAKGAMIFGDLEEQDSCLVKALAKRPSIVRKPWLGTEPKVFYLL